MQTKKLTRPEMIENLQVFSNHKTKHVLFVKNKQKGEWDQVSQGAKILLRKLAMPKATVLVVEHSGATTSNGASLFDPVRYKRIYGTREGEWKACDLKTFKRKLASHRPNDSVFVDCLVA